MTLRASTRGAEAEDRLVTTHSRRWPLAWHLMGVMAACILLVVAGLPSRAQAQPFAAAIMDVRTGEFLWQTDNANSRVHPASLTKMMTLYIAFEAIENGEISLDTRVRISRHAASQPPSRLGLRAGQTIAMRYLIRAAALRSANDAAVAIAEAIEGSVPNFAARMNRTAAAIGMNRTRFVNPHGLTADGHLSSARDMSRLGRQLYFDFPQYYGIFSRRSEDAGIATVANTNGRFLDSYRGADGIKTGFTNAAGYNLTAMAERNGVRILVTVMGARSGSDRLRRVTELMDRGFREAPRRATTRRPASPDYVRAPEDQGSGVAAGRTIRLQTAPTASRFPRPRPAPGAPLSEEMLASLRNDIDEVLEDIREPDPETDTEVTAALAGDTSEEPAETTDEAADEAASAEAPPAEAAAPTVLVLETSPTPRPRPEAVIANAEAVPVEGEVTEPAATEQPLDLAASDPASDPADQAAPGTAVPLQILIQPSAETPAEDTPAAPVETPLIAGTEDGAVLIPGLPPILPGVLQPEQTASATPLPGLEPVAADLSVDDEGRILWRDEELLTALQNGSIEPPQPETAPVIVLTTSGGDDSTPVAEPMPEIVARLSTSGGRLHRVELGLFASRFDAERALLRLALSESATLGAGVRRVSPRSGQFVAEVGSLAQDEAELACARLIARDQACTVVGP